MLQWETALPVHCYGQIYKNIEKPKENQCFFDCRGPEVEKDLKMTPKTFEITQSELKVTQCGFKVPVK